MSAGIQIGLRIGQRVLIRERVHGAAWHAESRKLDRTKLLIGHIKGLALEDDGQGSEQLMAHVTLERPYVSPAFGEYPALEIWRQHVPATDVLPYSDVDEILDALRDLTFACTTGTQPASERDPEVGNAVKIAEALLDRYTERGDALAHELALQADRIARGIAADSQEAVL